MDHSIEQYSCRAHIPGTRGTGKRHLRFGRFRLTGFLGALGGHSPLSHAFLVGLARLLVPLFHRRHIVHPLHGKSPFDLGFQVPHTLHIIGKPWHFLQPGQARPGLSGRSAPITPDQPHRHLGLFAELFGEEISDRRKPAPGATGVLHLPMSHLGVQPDPRRNAFRIINGG